MQEVDFVKVAKALADPTRHRMLREIRAAGRLTCTQVCSCFELSQPTISHHVKTLQEAGLLRIERDGQYNILSVDEDVLAGFAAELGFQAAKPARARRSRAAAPKRSPKKV